MKKNILLLFISIFFITASGLIKTDETGDDRNKYTIYLLVPNSEVSVNKVQVKPGEIDIVISAAESASKKILSKSLDKPEWDVLGDSFIRIEDNDGNEIYFSHLYRGYRMIEMLINGLSKKQEKYLIEKKLRLPIKKV